MWGLVALEVAVVALTVNLVAAGIASMSTVDGLLPALLVGLLAGLLCRQAVTVSASIRRVRQMRS